MPSEPRRHPLVIRILAVTAGSLLSLLALILMVPLPEAGLPLLILALHLLGFQFAWAQRLKQKVVLKLVKLKNHLAKRATSKKPETKPTDL